MARSKAKKKPVKGKKRKRSRRDKKVVLKEVIEPVKKPLGHKKRRKTTVRRKKEPVTPEVTPVKKLRKEKSKRKKPIPEEVEEQTSGIVETSGGMRRKYNIVLEEETYAAFSRRAYMRQEYPPVLLNQIVKIAVKSDIKVNKKDMEKWTNKKSFDDGINKTIKSSIFDSGDLVRPFDPKTKTYDRMRYRFTSTLEERAVDHLRKRIKSNLYACYLINHLMREHLRGNLDLRWDKQETDDSHKWMRGSLPHGGDIVPFEPGDPAATITHEWKVVLDAQKDAKKEEVKKPKRKRTIPCIYPGCKGRASRHVKPEDKNDVYYRCNKCEKTFHRTASKKDMVPEEPIEVEEEQ